MCEKNIVTFAIEELNSIAHRSKVLASIAPSEERAEPYRNMARCANTLKSMIEDVTDWHKVQETIIVVDHSTCLPINQTFRTLKDAVYWCKVNQKSSLPDGEWGDDYTIIEKPLSELKNGTGDS